MFRRYPILWFWPVALIGVLEGCDRATFAPVPSAPTDPTVSTPLAGKADEIVWILPAHVTEAHRICEQVGRAEAGLARVVLDAQRRKPGDPPGRQAELVRQAVKRRVSALIVEPEDPESIGPVLAEARAAGVPVVLVGQPVPVPGRPLPCVSLQPFMSSARKLVAAALEDAKDAGFPPEGTALILANSQHDEQTEERVAALETALKEAGVTHFERVEFGVGIPTPLVADAKRTVEEALAANPGIAMILAADDHGLSGAVQVRHDLVPEKLRDTFGSSEARRVYGHRGQFALAGYAANPRNVNLAKIHECAAVVDRNYAGLARQAIHVAVRLARGETVPDRIEVETPITTGLDPHPSGGPAPAGTTGSEHAPSNRSEPVVLPL